MTGVRRDEGVLIKEARTFSEGHIEFVYSASPWRLGILKEENH